MKINDFFENISLRLNELVEEVAEFIAIQNAQFDRKNIEHKGFNDLVSFVDKEAENRLIIRLKEIFPEAGFVTEEDKNNHLKTEKKYHWVIDPLDGTTNFVHQLPIFSISVALLEHNLPVVGAVYEVNRKECFSAWKGGGAYLNGKRIAVSPSKLLSESLLATGFPYYDFEKMPQYLEILKDFMQKTHGLRRLGSAAVDLAYVACGRFEGFFEYNLNAWDVAAGVLLVQEAGGKTATFNGNTTFDGKTDCIFGREIIAAGAIFEQMQSVISAKW